ncbi:MAG: hypothetical protein N2B03_09380, partial [Boseongicola sp.]
ALERYQLTRLDKDRQRVMAVLGPPGFNGQTWHPPPGLDDPPPSYPPPGLDGSSPSYDPPMLSEI